MKKFKITLRIKTGCGKRKSISKLSMRMTMKARTFFFGKKLKFPKDTTLTEK
jgi:hypothetical protein